jgi:hypothetical protein
MHRCRDDEIGRTGCRRAELSLHNRPGNRCACPSGGLCGRYEPVQTALLLNKSLAVTMIPPGRKPWRATQRAGAILIKALAAKPGLCWLMRRSFAGMQNQKLFATAHGQMLLEIVGWGRQLTLKASGPCADHFQLPCLK